MRQFGRSVLGFIANTSGLTTYDYALVLLAIIILVCVFAIKIQKGGEPEAPLAYPAPSAITSP